MKNLTLSLLSICCGLMSVVQAQTNLLNGPEGISYHQASKSYFVSNATDGKIIKLDSLSGQSIFYEGFSVPMGVEIIGDSLFVASNDPSTVSCIDVNNGELIGSMIISESPSMAHMDFDPRTGLLYVIGQSGKVFKINSATLTYNVFVASGLPNSTQTCSIDTASNCMYIFSWPATTVRSVNLLDSTDIQSLVYPALGQQIDCTKDASGYIYVSCWQGNKIIKYSPGCTVAPEVFSTGYNKPAGLTYNPDENIIVIANYGGNTIDMIELSPIVLNEHLETDFNLNIFPNPFQKVCNIEYCGPPKQDMRIDIYDAHGRLIRNLFNGYTNGSKLVFPFEAHQLSAGIYYCRMTANDKVIAKRLMICD